MSNIQTQRYLEQMEVNFDTALQHYLKSNNRAGLVKAYQIYKDLKSSGFDQEAQTLYERYVVANKIVSPFDEVALNNLLAYDN